MHTRNFYNLVTLRDGRTDNDQILEILTDIFEGKLSNDLRLLNYYHEIPVSYKTSILNISKDRVEFQIHQHQALLIKANKHTLLKSSHFPKGLGVHCIPAYVNLNREIAILTRLAYSNITAESRKAIRVAVYPPASAVFATAGPIITGTVIDISESGLSMLTNDEITLEENTEGTVFFTLSEKALEIPAFFLKTIETKEGCLCVLQYQVQGAAETIISQYIYSRQVEIIRELKDHLY